MVEIDRIYRIALERAIQVKEYRKRFAYHGLLKRLKALRQLKDKKPIIAVSGIRGIGKTTIMLQLFSELENSFFFSADSIAIKTSTLYDTVEQVLRAGYVTVFIDEVHKYPGWIDELKNIYDDFSVPVLVSGSSTAAIKKGCITLGRRADNVPLNPLSFGEFFFLKEGVQYTSKIEDAIDKNAAVRWLAEHQNVERLYNEYLGHGGFPIRLEEKNQIFKTIKRMIYEDALAEFSLTENKVDVAERLLAFLSVSRPGEFSYTSFSSMSGYAKSTVYEAVALLAELEILRVVEEGSPKAKAKKTIKLMFSHPNLRSAIAEQLMKSAEIGALREEYFLFHMAGLDYPVFLPKKAKKTPDYEVDFNGKRTLFEIGGESKTKKQMMGREGVVMDDEKLVVLGFVQKTDQK